MEHRFENPSMARSYPMNWKGHNRIQLQGRGGEIGVLSWERIMTRAAVVGFPYLLA